MSLLDDLVSESEYADQKDYARNPAQPLPHIEEKLSPDISLVNGRVRVCLKLSSHRGKNVRLWIGFFDSESDARTARRHGIKLIADNPAEDSQHAMKAI